MDLQTDMFAIRFRELQRIRDDALVVQHYTGTDDCLVHFVQFAIQRHGVDLLLMELRMGQFSCQVSVIGQQENTGRITVQTTHRVDTLGASATNNINHGMTLLRIVGRGHCILGFIEQDIDLAFAANRLSVETHIIRRQHFSAQIIHGLTIDGDHTGLDEIICLTTGTDTCVCEVFIQTNRLRRILMLLTIDLLFMSGINSGIAFRFASERTIRAL